MSRVVICGGGIIGACTAFYLAERGIASTIVEREDVACAASGKAGGFLALDWNDRSPVGKLSRLSFKLHQNLAERFGAEAIGYRPVTTLQVTATEAGSRSKVLTGGDRLPSWVDGNVASVELLGSSSTTAQVHPHLLTTALVAAAESKGSKVVKGSVSGLQTVDNGTRLTGVVLEGGDVIPADATVLAMGPWTALAADWLRESIQLEVTGSKYHSLVLRPEDKTTVLSHALFTCFKHSSGRQVEPEVYPRPDGSVYVCGEPQGSSIAVPASPSLVTVEQQLCENIRSVATSLCSSLSSATVEATQACYLPTTADGLPVIGQVPSLPGVIIATGHSCWGILNGPATGLVVSEMILDGAVRCLPPEGIDLLSPARLVSL